MLSTPPNRFRPTLVCLSFGLFIVTAGFSVESLAASTEQRVAAEVDKLHLEGVTLFKAGQYRPASQRFQRAYDRYPDPKLLYNIGRCHQALGDVERALDAYRRCENHPKARSDLVQQVRRRIDMLESVKAESARVAAKTAPVVGQTVAGPSTPSPNAVGPAASGTSSASGTGRRTAIAVAKWVTASVAIAALGVGIPYAIVGASDQGKVDDVVRDAGDGIVTSMTRAEALELQNDANSKKVIGYALIGVGIASAVASTVLFLIDRPSARGERQKAHTAALDLGIAPTAGGGAAWLRAHF